MTNRTRRRVNIYNDLTVLAEAMPKPKMYFSENDRRDFLEKLKKRNLSTLRSDKFIFGFDRVSAKTVNFPSQATENWSSPSLRSSEALNFPSQASENWSSPSFRSGKSLKSLSSHALRRNITKDNRKNKHLRKNTTKNSKKHLKNPFLAVPSLRSEKKTNVMKTRIIKGGVLQDNPMICIFCCTMILTRRYFSPTFDDTIINKITENIKKASDLTNAKNCMIDFIYETLVIKNKTEKDCTCKAAFLFCKILILVYDVFMETNLLHSIFYDPAATEDVIKKNSQYRIATEIFKSTTKHEKREAEYDYRDYSNVLTEITDEYLKYLKRVALTEKIESYNDANLIDMITLLSDFMKKDIFSDSIIENKINEIGQVDSVVLSSSGEKETVSKYEYVFTFDDEKELLDNDPKFIKVNTPYDFNFPSQATENCYIKIYKDILSKYETHLNKIERGFNYDEYLWIKNKIDKIDKIKFNDLIKTCKSITDLIDKKTLCHTVTYLVVNNDDLRSEDIENYKKYLKVVSTGCTDSILNTVNEYLGIFDSKPIDASKQSFIDLKKDYEDNKEKFSKELIDISPDIDIIIENLPPKFIIKEDGEKKINYNKFFSIPRKECTLEKFIDVLAELQDYSKSSPDKLTDPVERSEVNVEEKSNGDYDNIREFFDILKELYDLTENLYQTMSTTDINTKPALYKFTVYFTTGKFMEKKSNPGQLELNEILKKIDGIQTRINEYKRTASAEAVLLNRARWDIIHNLSREKRSVYNSTTIFAKTKMKMVGKEITFFSEENRKIDSEYSNRLDLLQEIAKLIPKYNDLFKIVREITIPPETGLNVNFLIKYFTDSFKYHRKNIAHSDLIKGPRTGNVSKIYSWIPHYHSLVDIERIKKRKDYIVKKTEMFDKKILDIEIKLGNNEKEKEKLFKILVTYATDCI
jgi:hypothetical protein